MPVWPEQEVVPSAMPDSDKPERLEQEKENHHESERGIVDRKQQAREALRSGQRHQRALDDVWEDRYERGPEQGAQKRAHAADDDHGDILDGQKQRECLDRDEAAIIGEQ